MEWFSKHMHVRPFDVIQVWKLLKTEYKQKRHSLHGKFALYLFIVVGAVLSALGLLLIFTGFLKPVDREFRNYLDQNLHAYSQIADCYYDNLSAHNIVFSQQLTQNITEVLNEHHATFADLNNNPDLLIAIQDANFDVVRNNLAQNSCSGVLYIMNATVNSSNPKRTYNGLYLKYANLHSENTLTNDINVFRGDYMLARKYDMGLFTTWQLEIDANQFKEIKPLMQLPMQPLAPTLVLTDTTQLLDTWERVRLLLVPIFDAQGHNLGVCGYEISNIYYQLRSPQSVYRGHSVITGLINQDENGAYTGQFNNDAAIGIGSMTLTKQGPYDILKSTRGSFIGKAMPITIANKQHLVVAMLPLAVYQEMRQEIRTRIGVVLAGLLILFIVAYFIFVKKYLNPLVNNLQQLAIPSEARPDFAFDDFDTVYDTWQNKTKEQQQQLEQQEELLLKLNADRKAARDAYDYTAKNLHDINEKQQRLLVRYREMQEELGRQFEELEQLKLEKQEAEKQYETARESFNTSVEQTWQMVDESGYQKFVDGLERLTPKEREIFACYEAKMTPKEIIDKLFISDNTLKFHNRNIYNKLGVKTRKDLLRSIELWHNNQEKKIE